ncbi:hypothetical protein DFQ27_000544, partial [Actinomortierella ambigua]
MKILSLFVVACLAASSTVGGAGVLVQNPQRKSNPGKYIVVLKCDPAVSASAASGMMSSFEAKLKEIAKRRRQQILSGGQSRKTPKVVNRLDALHGFTIEDAADDLQELLQLNEVDYIEEDAEYRINVPVPPAPSVTTLLKRAGEA